MDQIGAALGRLEPEARALLDLSLRRGLTDEEIAKAVGLELDAVADRREQVLHVLAADLGLGSAADLAELRATLRDLPLEHWRARAAEPPPDLASPESEQSAESPTGPDARATEGPPAEEEPRIALPFRRLVVGGVVIVLIGIGMGLVIASSEDEGERPPGAASQTTASSAPLRPLGAGAGRGTARITGAGRDARLLLEVGGLPPPTGAYEVWLYDSVTEAVSLARFERTRISLDAALPRDPAGYDYIDISREPPDGNPNHSGESVLRVALDRLR